MRAFLEGRLRTKSSNIDKIDSSGRSSPLTVPQSHITGTPQKIHPDLQALVSSPTTSSRRVRARSASGGDLLYRTESAHARTRSDLAILQAPTRMASVPALSRAYDSSGLVGMSPSVEPSLPFGSLPSNPPLSPPPPHTAKRLNSSQDLTVHIDPPSTQSILPISPSLDSLSYPLPGSLAGNRSSSASNFSRSGSESPPQSRPSSKVISPSVQKRFSVSAVTYNTNDPRPPTSPSVARVSFITNSSSASHRNTIGSQSFRSSQHSHPSADGDRSASSHHSKASPWTHTRLRSASPQGSPLSGAAEVKTPLKAKSLPSFGDSRSKTSPVTHRSPSSAPSSQRSHRSRSPDSPPNTRQPPPLPSLTTVLGVHAINTPSTRRQSAFMAAKQAESSGSNGWERKVAEEMIKLSVARGPVSESTPTSHKKDASLASSKKSRGNTVANMFKSSPPKESSASSTSSSTKKSKAEPISASATFGVLSPNKTRTATGSDTADEFGEGKASATPSKKPRRASVSSSGKNKDKENGSRSGSSRSGVSAPRPTVEKVHVHVVEGGETGEGIVESWKLEMDIPDPNLEMVAATADVGIGGSADLFKFIKEKEIHSPSPLESKTPTAKRWRVRKRTLSSGAHAAGGGARRRTLSHRASSSGSNHSHGPQNQEICDPSPAVTVFTVSTPDISFGNTTTTSTVDEFGVSSPTRVATESVIPEEPHTLPVLPLPSRSRLRVQSDASRASSSRTSVSATGSPMPKRLSAAAMDSQSLFFSGNGGGSRLGGSRLSGVSDVEESSEDAVSTMKGKGKRLGGGEKGDELDRDLMTPDGQPYERQRKESVVEDDVLGELPVNPRKRLKVSSNAMRVQSLASASSTSSTSERGQSSDERRLAGDPFYIATPGAGPSRYSPPNRNAELKGILAKQASEGGSYTERDRDRNDPSRASSRRSQSVSFSTMGGAAPGQPLTPGHGRSPTDSSFTSTFVGSATRRRHSTPWSDTTVGGSAVNGARGRIPMMAILSPRPPSIVPGGSSAGGRMVYHMREPRRYNNNNRASASVRTSVIRGQPSFTRDRRVSSREMLNEEVESRDLRSPTSDGEFRGDEEVRVRSGLMGVLPLQGWAFFVGFFIPFCWWFAAFSSVGGRDGVKDDVEVGVQAGATYTLQDIVTWRRRCRLMSGFSILVYVPVITLAVIFGR